jgi:hypothetical protein
MSFNNVYLFKNWNSFYQGPQQQQKKSLTNKLQLFVTFPYLRLGPCLRPSRVLRQTGLLARGFGDDDLSGHRLNSHLQIYKNKTKKFTLQSNNVVQITQQDKH